MAAMAADLPQPIGPVTQAALLLRSSNPPSSSSTSSSSSCQHSSHMSCDLSGMEQLRTWLMRQQTAGWMAARHCCHAHCLYAAAMENACRSWQPQHQLQYPHTPCCACPSEQQKRSGHGYAMVARARSHIRPGQLLAVRVLWRHFSALPAVGAGRDGLPILQPGGQRLGAAVVSTHLPAPCSPVSRMHCRPVLSP